MLTHAPWMAVGGLRHGFLDRSRAPDVDGWTVSSGTTTRPVAVPRQVHGSRVVRHVPDQARPEADGLSTGVCGVWVGVVTADCVPVLLIDPQRRIAAAIHAGWRGASQGVLEEAVRHLADLYGSRPEDLEAAIGPAIGGCCYEVGPEVAAAFREHSGDLTAAAWHEGPRRPHLDLRTAVRCILAEHVHAVSTLGPCTACDRRYHSYRRDAAAVGRQLSFVGWE